MGMFDEFLTNCPYCGEQEIFQTKAGPCYLASYTKSSEDIPYAVVCDLQGQRKTCSSCGENFSLELVMRPELVARK